MGRPRGCFETLGKVLAGGSSAGLQNEVGRSRLGPSNPPAFEKQAESVRIGAADGERGLTRQGQCFARLELYRFAFALGVTPAQRNSLQANQMNVVGSGVVVIGGQVQSRYVPLTSRVRRS